MQNLLKLRESGGFAFMFLLLFSVSHPNSQASTLQFLDTQTLTHAAKSIQVGTVTSKWSSWDPEKKMIYTYIRLSVTENVKGKADKEVLIRQAGGEVNGYGMRVHGMAHFRKGERALVFLGQDSDGAPSVLGMSQGKFRIGRDASTKEEFAHQDLPQDIELVQKLGSKFQRLRNQHHKKVPLRDLILEIKNHIKDSQAGDRP